MALDLGQIITDLGTSYLKNRFDPGRGTVGPFVPITTPAFNPLDPFAFLSEDAPDASTVTAASCPGKLVSCRVGPDGQLRLVKRSRRRHRKRLASASDIRDLGALKAVLSPKDFTAWIATRGRG